MGTATFDDIRRWMKRAGWPRWSNAGIDREYAKGREGSALVRAVMQQAELEAKEAMAAK